MGGDLISMAFVEVMEDYSLGRKIRMFSQATSAKYFDDESMKVHGFSYWQAMKFPHRMFGIEKYMEWIEPIKKKYGQMDFIYYANAYFDLRWLKEHFNKENSRFEISNVFPEQRAISVLQLARENLKHIKESEKINPVTGKLYTKYSLQNVCDHYGIPLNHHEVLSDAIACALIWGKIMKGENTWSGKFL